MAKMTKAQAKRRLMEAAGKVGRTGFEYHGLTQGQRDKLYKIRNELLDMVIHKLK